MLDTWDTYAIAKKIIIFCAVVAVVWIALKAFKITPPDWVINLIIVVVAAACALLALRFLAAL